MGKRKAVVLLSVMAILVSGFFVSQAITLRKAHSTFENYYTFRGCTQLLDKTADYGTCKTASGQVIKIVRYKDKWYLDGDLPVCWFNICQL